MASQLLHQPDLDDVRQRLKKVQDTLELGRLDAATLTSLAAKEASLYEEEGKSYGSNLWPPTNCPSPSPIPAR
jgi:hypothetical protein